MLYLGKPASAIDQQLMKRGYAALDGLERRLGEARFLLGEVFSLADIASLAYTRVAHEGGFDLAGYDSVRRWIAECEERLNLPAERP
jgi:glutathione S-transferase